MNTTWPTPLNNGMNPQSGPPGAASVFKEEKPGPFEWWYRLTAPAEPPATAPLAQREAARRGRLASTTLLFMTLVTIIPLPVALISHNRPLLIVLLVTLLVNGVALVFNRLGYLLLAGILFITVLDGGIALQLLTTPGGLAMSSLPSFDLLAESLLVAVAFFPAWTVFPLVLINSLFIWVTFTFEPHTVELGSFLATTGGPTRAIILQIIVACVTYLWVQSATRAIARADHAEVIVALERREIERQQHELELKRQLDTGIQQILETHVQVSNGNFTARAPLNQDNILWRIAYSLNNLLARLYSSSQAEAELRRMKTETARLVEFVRIAREHQRPMPFWRSGTDLDPLILELSSIPSGTLSPLPGGQAPQAIHSPRKPNGHRLEKMAGTTHKEQQPLDPAQPKNLL